MELCPTTIWESHWTKSEYWHHAFYLGQISTVNHLSLWVSMIFLDLHKILMGTQWHSWLRHCATSRKVAGRFLMVSLEFFIDIILPVTLWPWGRFRLQQKWVPGIFPGRWRRPVCRADNLFTFMCQLSWNMGASTSWNPLGLSRPVMGLLYLLRKILKYYFNVDYECFCPHSYQLTIHNHSFNFSFHVNYATDTVALCQTNYTWDNFEMLVYILCPCFVHVLHSNHSLNFQQNVI
jgi:hypothetical protein